MPGLEDALTDAERAEVARCATPFLVQEFLDQIAYDGDDRNRSPLGVIRERHGHCFDGALLGAALLRRLGYRPQVLDMWPEPGTDDDHVLALFQVDGYWGAVAKSNFVNLRFREPVFRTLRELIMSYFENFFNADGQKTLRSFTMPVDLRRYDAQNWEVNEDTVELIEEHLNRMRRIPVINERQRARLSPVDSRALQAGMLGTNPSGLFKKDH